MNMLADAGLDNGADKKTKKGRRKKAKREAFYISSASFLFVSRFYG